MRQAHRTAGLCQRRLACQRGGVLILPRQYRHDSRETRVRDADSRQRIRNGLDSIQSPGDAERPRNAVGDEGIWRNPRGAERPGIDAENRHREHISRFRTLDVDRSRKRMHRAANRIRISRIHVGTVGVQLQVRGIASLEQKGLARLGAGRHGNVGMQAVEALGILPAMPSGPADHDDIILCAGEWRTQERRTRRDRSARTAESSH